MYRRDNEWQLVFFTILTQMAAGTFFIWGLVVIFDLIPGPILNGLYIFILLMVVLSLLILGTLAAGLHLGRPFHAVFSLNNLRSSWLSREALLGSNFGLIALALLLRRAFGQEYSNLDKTLIVVGIFYSLALVYGISRLYMLRTVPAWNNPGTPWTFFTTTFLLGIMATTTIWYGLVFWDEAQAVDMFLTMLASVSGQLIIILAAIQLVIFIFQILYLNSQGGAAAHSLQILWTDLRGMLIWRILTLIAGVGLLIFQPIMGMNPAAHCAAFGLILVSEILGRFLFYGFYQQEGF